MSKRVKKKLKEIRVVKEEKRIGVKKKMKLARKKEFRGEKKIK